MMPSVTSRLKKNINRTKQKILQGMGKTDQTYDENFDLYAQNFEHQHKQASKLTQDLNKYINCLRETQKSSKAFYETLKETYEIGWPNSNMFYEQIHLIELKWMEYLTRMNNDVQLPLIAYLNEFPELRKKIEKRSNRLLDYDNARQTLQNIQNKAASKTSSSASANTGKHFTKQLFHGNNHSSSTNTEHSTENLTKITKLKIDLEDKKQIYDEINQTLCLSLPVLYENRIKFYSSLLQSFFHTETIFYSDCAEVKSKLDNICETLSNKTAVNNLIANSQSFLSNSSAPIESSNGEMDGTVDVVDIEQAAQLKEEQPASPQKSNDSSEKENVEIKSDQNNEEIITQSDDLNESTKYYTTRTTNTLMKQNYLYKVKANYSYQAKELDELTFAKDDSIQVVEGTESEKEDLDDGWLIGIHETSNKRGIFPENFTRKLN